MHLLGLALLVSLITAPATVLGATTIPTIVQGFTEAIVPLVAVALGIAVLVFVWGLALYILRAGDDEQMEEGRQRMLWGVVALFMIVSVWGIVVILENIVGVGPTNTCPPPQIGEDTVTDCF